MDGWLVGSDMSVFPIYNEMRNRTDHKMNFVVYVALTVSSVRARASVERAREDGHYVPPRCSLARLLACAS